MESVNTEHGKKVVAQTINKISDFASDKANLISEATDKGIEMAKERLEYLEEESAALVKATAKAIRRNPFGAVAIAAGVGFVVAGVASIVFRGNSRN